jgi:hypothetical protein
MALLNLFLFFSGVALLAFAIFVYLRISMFPDQRNAQVMSSVCGADECKVSLKYVGADGRDRNVNVFTDDRVKRESMPVRVSNRDAAQVIIDYPPMLNPMVMSILGVTGFILVTSSLTSLINAIDQQNVSPQTNATTRFATM